MKIIQKIRQWIGNTFAPIVYYVDIDEAQKLVNTEFNNYLDRVKMDLQIKRDCLSKHETPNSKTNP